MINIVQQLFICFSGDLLTGATLIVLAGYAGEGGSSLPRMKAEGSSWGFHDGSGNRPRPLWQADKVIFLNDVYFCARDIVRLLQHDADMVCGLDFDRPRLQDAPTSVSTPGLILLLFTALGFLLALQGLSVSEGGCYLGCGLSGWMCGYVYLGRWWKQKGSRRKWRRERSDRVLIVLCQCAHILDVHGFRFSV